MKKRISRRVKHTLRYILIATFASSLLAFPSIARRVTMFNLEVCGLMVLVPAVEGGGLIVRE